MCLWCSRLPPPLHLSPCIAAQGFQGLGLGDGQPTPLSEEQQKAEAVGDIASEPLKEVTSDPSLRMVDKALHKGGKEGRLMVTDVLVGGTRDQITHMIETAPLVAKDLKMTVEEVRC